MAITKFGTFDVYSGSFYTGPCGEIGVVCSYPEYNVYECKVKGTTEQEMRESFEQLVDAEFAPKPNKIQKHLYGDRLNSLDRKTLQDIVDNNRGMGNTTAHAMKQVAEAIQNPGKAIKLVSDHGDLSQRMLKAPGGYLWAVKKIIEKLDLKFLVVRENECTLTYEV